MLFSHLALFLEYTIVHYSARQKYREQVITDAQLRKLMAFDEVAAEILSNPQLAAACGLVAKDTNGGGVPSRLDLQTERTPPRSPGSLSGRLTSAAAGGGGGGDVDGWSAGPPAAAALPTSLSPQELEEALASMPAEAKRQILHKLRTARARLGGSVSEWGETPEEFYPSRGGRKWAKVGGAPSSGAAMAAAAGEGRGMFGFGGRETIATAGPIQQAGDDDDADVEMRASGETEDDDEMGGGGGGPAGLNVTPGRELPGTPDKAMRGRRLRRLRDRSTTDHAIVGSLSEPLFGDSGTDPSAGGSALGSGPPPHLPGQSSSSPVEELELGDHPDDDTKVRKREWCGGRMKAKARHFCSHFVDWYVSCATCWHVSLLALLSAAAAGPIARRQLAGWLARWLACWFICLLTRFDTATNALQNQHGVQVQRDDDDDPSEREQPRSALSYAIPCRVLFAPRLDLHAGGYGRDRINRPASRYCVM